MPTQVIMPQLGESVVEGTVSRWLKREGERVDAFEPLLEVSTDKVDTEIPSPASGVLLRVLVPEGQTVAKGTLLALIGQPEELSEAPQAASAPPNGTEHQSDGRGEPQETGGGSHVTPVVARMAAEHGIDLKQIAGTGRGGRVTKRDIEAYLEAQKQAQTATAHAADAPAWAQPGSGDLFKATVDYDIPLPSAPSTSTPVKPAAPERLHPVEPIPAGVEGELVPLTAMRRAIAEHMVRSVHTAPHVTTVFEVDMSAVLAHREAYKEEFARLGVNLTLTAYFAAATVEALRAAPTLNGRWTDEGIYVHRAVHLGLAVAVEDGLIVPVIKNAQTLNLLGLARAVNDLAARARSKQLSLDEVQGGTFSITNHGVGGSLVATPILNEPQAGILGVGVVEKRVRVITDAQGRDMIAIRPCCYVSLTFDHRVGDGALGDAFLLALKRKLESWA